MLVNGWDFRPPSAEYKMFDTCAVATRMSPAGGYQAEWVAADGPVATGSGVRPVNVVCHVTADATVATGARPGFVLLFTSIDNNESPWDVMASARDRDDVVAYCQKYRHPTRDPAYPVPALPKLALRLTPTTKLILRNGDLTRFDGCAIVNSANERMLGGTGVDGAIHRAAGPALLAACKQVPEVRPRVRCPTGEARITPGGALPAAHVIHTVGPVYRSAARSAPLLESAYRSSLQLANQQGLKTIALPAISCGVYGYPFDEAAEIAVRTCQQEAGNLSEIHFFLFGDAAMSAWVQAAEAAGLGQADGDDEETAPGEAGEGGQKEEL